MHRLAEVSTEIIDQCVAQGVPFAREYGGLLDNRSFGGAQVSRTFYARGQTGQQLLLGAYQALERQIAAGTVEMHTRHEMLELIVVDGKARGIVVRDLVTGEIAHRDRRRRRPRHRRLRQRVLPVDERHGLQHDRRSGARTARAPTSPTPATRRSTRRASRSPASTSRSSRSCPRVLRNDGRVWVPKSAATTATPPTSPRTSATTTWSAATRPSATSCPATSPRAPRRASATTAAAWAPAGSASTSTSPTPSSASAARPWKPSTATCSTCTSGSPARTRTSGRCASTRPCTTRWAACGWTTTCQSNIPGLFVIGEANFSDHGANRLGASALMQGLRTATSCCRTRSRTTSRTGPSRPWTRATRPWSPPASEVDDRIECFLNNGGDRTVDSFHRELGKIMWEYCGMARTDEGLRKAIGRIRELRERVLAARVKVTGKAEELNQALEKAGRVADFFELGELMCIDALHRTESCGGHFREEYQTADGEAQARRRRTSRTSRPGSSPATDGARPAQGSPRVRKRQARPAELQVNADLCRRLAPERTPTTKGAMVDLRGRRRVAEDMSFLEMLDVLNERLIADGRGPDRVRPRLPRGHLRCCRLMINGEAHGPQRGHHDLPAAHAQLQGRRRRSTSSRGGRGRSRSSRIWCVDRSAFDRIIQAGGYISVPTGGRPDAHAVPMPRRTPTRRSTRRPASAAARAWRPARTAPACCSSAPR